MRALSAALEAYRTIWVVDFEFCRSPTGLPDVVCLAAWELRSGRRFALWRDEIGSTPPYDVGPDSVFVCYSGMEAELACHLTLGWPLPDNVIDLIVEYRMAINGREGGMYDMSMLAACARFDVATSYSPVEKDAVRTRILAGWPFTEDERATILHMCVADVDEEGRLFLALPSTAVSDWAIHRGDFIKAVARMWFRGVPIDPLYAGLATDRTGRVSLRESIIKDLRGEFDLWDGLHLKAEKLETFLINNGIPVPRTDKAKRVVTASSQYERLAADYPVLQTLADGLHTLGQLEDFNLPLGSDHRLRAWFAPFWTKTSRCAPGTNAYIYNLPAWFRATMSPPPGWALVYHDWSGMEFFLAAILSGCPQMLACCDAVDPYIAAAIMFDMLPADATRLTHEDDREAFKTGLLMVQYGGGEETLARYIKRSVPVAARMIRGHRRVFQRYWVWSDAIVAEMILRGLYRSRLGWECAILPEIRTVADRDFPFQSLRNRIIQTTGADILRTAVIFADQLDLCMIATAHDAILQLVPIEELETRVQQMELCMQRAGELLLDGYKLRVKTEIKLPGERFLEKRGRRTFEIVDRFLRGRDARTHS